MRFKFFVITIVVLFSFTSVEAQNVTLSIGPEVSFPSGNSSNRSSIGAGGFLKAELGISDQFALTAQGSVVSFFGKRFFGTTMPTKSYVPVKGGFKYYPSEGFYLEGQLGASIPLGDNEQTAFLWSPGIGTHLNTRNSNRKIDIGIRYEGWTSARSTPSSGISNTSFNFIALRVGYLFGL